MNTPDEPLHGASPYEQNGPGADLSSDPLAALGDDLHAGSTASLARSRRRAGAAIACLPVLLLALGLAVMNGGGDGEDLAIEVAPVVPDVEEAVEDPATALAAVLNDTAAARSGVVDVRAIAVDTEVAAIGAEISFDLQWQDVFIDEGRRSTVSSTEGLSALGVNPGVWITRSPDVSLGALLSGDCITTPWGFAAPPSWVGADVLANFTALGLMGEFSSEVAEPVADQIDGEPAQRFDIPIDLTVAPPSLQGTAVEVWIPLMSSGFSEATMRSTPSQLWAVDGKVRRFVFTLEEGGSRLESQFDFHHLDSQDLDLGVPAADQVINEGVIRFGESGQRTLTSPNGEMRGLSPGMIPEGPRLPAGADLGCANYELPPEAEPEPVEAPATDGVVASETEGGDTGEVDDSLPVD